MVSADAPTSAPQSATDPPIDLVYTWVDGDDPAWRERRDRYRPAAHNRPARWRSNDELRHSLRSAHLFAPWLRRIHVLTDGQRPRWLDAGHPKVRLVAHAEVCRWPGHLPTFNSCSVECHLHRIPGLSERFLYANDDMFFGRPAAPGDFFTPEGKVVVGLSDAALPRTYSFWPTLLNAGAAPGVWEAARLLRGEFGDRDFRFPVHQIKPYTKELFRRAEARWPGAFERCSANRFRGEGDIALNLAMLHPLALAWGLGEPRRLDERNCGPATVDEARRCVDEVRRERPLLFCVNDNSEKGLGLGPLLEGLFPEPSPFERG